MIKLRIPSPPLWQCKVGSTPKAGKRPSFTWGECAHVNKYVEGTCKDAPTVGKKAEVHDLSVPHTAQVMYHST